MKKKCHLLIIVLLIVLSSNVYSQRITYGVKGGISLPGFVGGNPNNPIFLSNTFKSGTDYGLYCEYHLSTLFSFSLGFEYSQQGGLNTFQAYPVPTSWSEFGFGPYVYSNFKNDTKLNYLTIPVLARRSWKLKHKFGAYAGAGPFAGILINATSRLSETGDIYLDKERTRLYSSPNTDNLFNANSKSELNKINLGVQGIAGVSYRFNKKDVVFIEAGISYGIRAVQYQATSGKSHTLTGTITAGYAYTFQDGYKNRIHRKQKSDIYKK